MRECDNVTAVKVRLNGYCVVGDECNDINAVCRSGVCICQPGYYDNGRDACGTRQPRCFYYKRKLKLYNYSIR